MDVTAASAQSVTDVVVMRRGIAKAQPNNGKSTVVKHCGTTMTDTKPWGIDAEGYTRLGTATSDAKALEMCEAQYNATKRAGVCGYNASSGYSVYYFNTTNTRVVSSGNHGAMCT